MQLIALILVICSVSGAITNLHPTTSNLAHQAKYGSTVGSSKNISSSVRPSYLDIAKHNLTTLESEKTTILENRTHSDFRSTVTVSYERTTESIHILKKIHKTLTRSKDAVWATITLTFMCVLLVISVAQSQMWKDYSGSESQGVPLPNFNERVIFKDVMEHKIKSFRKLFPKKKPQSSELESLLQPGDSEDESTSIPIDSS